METAERIMAPYTLKAPFIEWWSIYDVAQRGVYLSDSVTQLLRAHT